MMTPEEALALTDESIVRGEVVDDAYNYAFWEVVRKALKKQIPKKPFEGNDCVTAGNKIYSDYRCPACGKQVYFYESLCKRQYLFVACQCGQRIDWSDEE